MSFELCCERPSLAGTPSACAIPRIFRGPPSDGGYCFEDHHGHARAADLFEDFRWACVGIPYDKPPLVADLWELSNLGA